MKTYNLKFIFLALLTFPFISFAREGIPQDFAFYVEKSDVDITVKLDGSYEDVTTESFMITKDEARSFFAPFKFSFDPTSEDITVLDAYVINDGTKIEVDRR